MFPSVCASLRVLEGGSDSVIQAEMGRDIALACNYDLEEEEEVLHSIKWYRADKAGKHGNNFSFFVLKLIINLSYFYFDPKWCRSSTDIYLEVKLSCQGNSQFLDISDGFQAPSR